MDIFRNTTKSVPKKDGQIVRVNMEEYEISGRKSHLPAQLKSDPLTVEHVSNSGSGSQSS